MRALVPKKTSLLLVGLPRSGTTISAKFFNSFENSFFLAGPILHFVEEKKRDFPVIGHVDTIEELIEKVEAVDRDLVGTKENFWTDSLHLDRLDLFDHTVFIFREPKVCFSSWKRDYYLKTPRQGLLDVKIFVENYKTLWKTHREMPGSFAYLYEDFCEDPVQCIRRCFGGLLEIEGDCELQPLHDGTKGDDKARESPQVVGARKSFEDISPVEAEYIDSQLLAIWKELQNECRG